MTYKRLVLISAIGLLLLPGCNAPTELSAPKVTAQQLKPQLSEAQMRQLIESITVRVMAGEYGGGSGALIRKDGQVYTVLTNEHVVKPGKAHRIRTPDGKEYPAEIVKVREHGYDMAILQFAAAAEYVVVTLASSPGKVPQPVFAAGFPYDARDLLITKGEFSMFPSQAMLDGYQIGYTNNVRQGMSGGPVLNAEGKLIGINGMSAYPILQDAYEFADGSYPSDELRKEMNRLSWGVPIQRLAEVDPSLEVLLRPYSVASRPSLTGVAAEVNDIARQITVRIEKKRTNGSGVIIAQRGKTYYVLTADHVVKDENEYEVVTHDGKRYSVDYGKVRRLGVDLAVLQFESKERYRVATLANYDLGIEERPWVFLSGWPGLKPGESRSADPEFTAGLVFSKERGSLKARNSLSLTETNGYELVYSNPSQGGMSGGPVLDARGRVIGIHAAAEGNFLLSERASIQLGYSLGVPVRTFLSLARRADVKHEWLQVEKSPPRSLNTQESIVITQSLFTAQKPPKGGNAIDWMNYGNKMWRLFAYEESVAAFDEAIKLKPKFEQAWYARGVALTEQEKYQEAVESFDKATKIHPRIYEAWREGGRALSKLKRYSKALKYFDEAININKEDYVLYGLRGLMLQKLERYAEAVEAYSKAIELKPHLFIYHNRGKVRSDVGDLQGALADYNKAIEIQPDFAEAHNNRGNVRKNLGDYQGAIADFNKAIELKPDFAGSYSNRGNARYNLGDYQGAIADFNKAIELKPDFALAYNNRGLVHSDLGDLQGALADFNKAIEIKPDFALAYNNRGNARFDLGDYQGAIADFNKVIKFNPNFAEAYLNRGIARYHLRDLQGALADYNRVMELNPVVAIEVYNHRGLARFDLGDYQGAIADYTKAIEFKPDYADAYLNRGIARQELGDFQKAIADYNKAIELNPDYAEAYLNRGAARYNLGDLQGALADYNIVMELNPDLTIEVYNNRGLVRSELGDYKGAIADYTKAIEFKPDYADAYLNRGIARQELGDLQKAIADYQKAAEIFRERGRMVDYQKAQEILRELQQ